MSILALTANTLAGTAGAGQIEYDGQFYATDSNASRGQIERLVQGTAVASTSGTSITFTGIPSWAKRITVMFNGISVSGTANILVQLGSGSATTTGYASGGGAAGSGGTGANSTSGFIIYINGAVNIAYGVMTITNVSSNLWVSGHAMGLSNTGYGLSGGGSISLAGTLDRVIITTTNGTDTFDAGSINIMYEG